MVTVRSRLYLMVYPSKASQQSSQATTSQRDEGEESDSVEGEQAREGEKETGQRVQMDAWVSCRGVEHAVLPPRSCSLTAVAFARAEEQQRGGAEGEGGSPCAAPQTL